MKSRMLILLLLGAMSIVAGIAFKVLHLPGGNQFLISGIFFESIIGVLFVLQIARPEHQELNHRRP